MTGRLLVFPGKDPVSFHFARQLSAYLLGLNSREGDVNYFLEVAITKYYFQSSTGKIKQKTEKNNHIGLKYKRSCIYFTCQITAIAYSSNYPVKNRTYSRI